MINFEDKYAKPFINKQEIESIKPQTELAHKTINEKSGPGNDFLGWVSLPYDYDKNEFQKIKATAEKIKRDSDILVVIGIGGSYLGARAAIEFIKSPIYNSLSKDTPDILFAGNSISSDALSDILDICENKRVSVNVISKSGTTTEPAIAFRIFRDFLYKKYGDEAKDRIYCTTDKAKGTLKALADKEGYETFVIPDDIGGRFSVLTAVGLLPIAVAGCDIDALIAGAKTAADDFNNSDFDNNACNKYAALRNILYRKGKNIEMLVSYEPRFALMAEWWKQLFGESEGKDQKGIFPASGIYSTDLHSLGQYVQDGMRTLFETVVVFKKSNRQIVIEKNSDDGDGLNFLADKSMDFINEKAFLGTVLAHTDGGVPNLVIELPDASEKTLGYLIYFFEKACAVSGYLLAVNPFDQPGVEDYKNNMFALLGKPGFEKEKKILQKKLNT